MKFQIARLSQILSAFTLCVFAFGHAEATETSGVITKISPEDIPQLISEKNKDFAASKLNLEAQRKRAGSLARSFLPEISAQAGTEKFKAGSTDFGQQEYWKVEATVNVYNGGKDQYESDLRKAATDIALYSHNLEYQKQLSEATEAYWDLFATKQLILDTEEALKKNESQIKSANRRVGAGIVTTSDATQFVLHKTYLERTLKKLKIHHDISSANLSLILGLSETEKIEIIQEFPLIKKDTLIKSLPGESLAVKAEHRLIDSEVLKSSKLNSWWQPKIDIYSSYGLPSLSDDTTRALAKDREWSTGIRISLDLGKGANDILDRSAKNLEIEAAKLRLARQKRQLIHDNSHLIQDAALLRELIASADNDIQRAENFLKLTQNEYARGLKNGPDLLQAFQNYYETKKRKVEYYQDYFKTQAELELQNAEVRYE